MPQIRRVVKPIICAAASAVLALSAGTAAHADDAHESATASGSYQGCDEGYVCLYPQDTGWNDGHPSHTWYYYGAYNLRDQYGTHRFLNNQTGGAKAWLCTSYDGVTCPSYQPAGSWSDINFTPINSVKLTP